MGGRLFPPYYCLPPHGFENLATSLFCVKRLCFKIQSCEITIFKVGKLGWKDISNLSCLTSSSFQRIFFWKVVYMLFFKEHTIFLKLRSRYKVSEVCAHFENRIWRQIYDIEVNHCSLLDFKVDSFIFTLDESLNTFAAR